MSELYISLFYDYVIIVRFLILIVLPILIVCCIIRSLYVKNKYCNKKLLSPYHSDKIISVKIYMPRSTYDDLVSDSIRLKQNVNERINWILKNHSRVTRPY